MPLIEVKATGDHSSFRTWINTDYIVVISESRSVDSVRLRGGPQGYCTINVDSAEAVAKAALRVMGGSIPVL